jgi:hypothetical protein
MAPLFGSVLVLLPVNHCSRRAMSQRSGFLGFSEMSRRFAAAGGQKMPGEVCCFREFERIVNHGGLAFRARR